jgi:asparagine synthase (glutamine-hydrolysing)
MIALLGKTAAPDAARARAMLGAAPHRGDCVTLRVLGKCVVGVATRADFLDGSVSREGPVVAALSGRIDNAAELYRELSAAGIPPASTADADVLVAAFRAHGPDAPRRMRGCFAGVVTDGSMAWCFRDHIGFRPLFYRDEPRVFVAASEARQVVVGAQLKEEPDLEVLVGMLYGRMPADLPAALKGVARLPQATTLTVSADLGPSLRKYWDPSALIESSRLTPADARDRFRELLAQAVSRSLMGKDAVMLSGGLDSPSVAAFAAPEYRRRTGGPLGALSAVFPELPAVDERAFIEQLAEHFGMELHTYRPRARTLDDPEKWCRLFGSPVPVVSVPELADNHARAHELGFGNLLTGDFAEFAFGSPMHLVSHLLTHGRWLALGRLLATERRRGASARRLAQHLFATFVPGRVANRYIHWRGLDFPQRIPGWLDANEVNKVPYRSDLLPPARERWRQVQHIGLSGATITMEADEICAALAGVTIRRPFADVDLWEFFLGLRAEVKCPDLRFKSLVRGMMRGTLPDSLLDRPRKTVFDDHVMTQVDYPTLKRLLAAPRHRITGVDYLKLAQRIESEAFTRFDWLWAKDLALIHAFLNAW